MWQGQVPRKSRTTEQFLLFYKDFSSQVFIKIGKQEFESFLSHFSSIYILFQTFRNVSVSDSLLRSDHMKNIRFSMHFLPIFEELLDVSWKMRSIATAPKNPGLWIYDLDPLWNIKAIPCKVCCTKSRHTPVNKLFGNCKGTNFKSWQKWAKTKRNSKRTIYLQR